MLREGVPWEGVVAGRGGILRADQREAWEVHAMPMVVCVQEEEPLPDGWMGYKTKEGRPYFHNKLLGSTVWSKPRLSKTERERWRKKREAEKKAASKSTEDKTLAAFLSGV